MDGAAASNATSASAASVMTSASVTAASAPLQLVSPALPGLSPLHNLTSAPVSAVEVDPYSVQPDMSAWVGHCVDSV